jgi:signal transduction histidine kinase/DNA-binding response OmpR family regulator
MVGYRSNTLEHTSADWLVGGGEMGDLARAFDWSKTPLGPIQSWPQSLHSALSICLGSRFPIVIYWGADLVVLYNDAYAEILGKKHPFALGRPCREVWAEIWDVIAPMLDRVLATGHATWSEDQLLLLERRGYPEECYFSFSFSPVRGAHSKVEGIFTAVIENTRRVLGERRLRTLRDLGAAVGEAESAEEVCRIAASTLADNRADVPFALLYLVDPQGRRGSLVASAGSDNGIAAPSSFELDGPAHVSGWPLASVCRTGETARVERPPSLALVLPLAMAGESHCMGVLVTGISPQRDLDEDYAGFFELIARRIAAAIAEARAYEDERRRAEALAEIDRAKTAFFSNVSHEFRTPLTLMLGPLEDTLARSKGLAPADRDQLETVQRNSLRLLKLVNTLLDFSRIEAGRVQAVYEPTDLAAATAELASVFRAAIEKAGLKLIVDCPPLPEPAYVDRDMWEKIVLNLVSNAFKFTFAGEIEIRLRESAGHVELAVRDTGSGIPYDELPKLFERFHRVAGARGRTYEGSGIGLALVQELVKLHGGSATADSVLGRGSTFTVVIPLGRGHLPAGQIGAPRTQTSTALGASAFVEEALRWLPSAGAEEERVIPDIDVAAHLDEGPIERPRILLADDNADMRDYVRRLLASRYDVEAAGDGEAALAAIARNKPDLVLSDIMMPRLDGMQLLAKLRADPATSTVPVILLSARAGEESRVEGMQAAADDYLIKPFSARELLARVEAHLKMSRYRSEATETLRASEERFRAFVTASSDVVYRMSPDWREMRYLRGKDFIADTEHPSEGWLEKYIHPDDHAHVLSAINDAIHAKSTFELEHRVIRVDGSLGWTHSRAIPMLGANDEIVEWFGAARDITERRRAEETQRMLTSELTHRVKNMLATVQAIATQTLRHNKDPTHFVTSFGGRIQSMSRIHSLLSSSDWQGADLRDVIRDQLLLGPVDDTRVTAWGPAVRLEAHMAPQVAMMLHELGTNSIKYGALSKADGIVTVSWAVNADTLCLRWAERGGPPVNAPVRRGFGTALIEQSAKGAGGSAQMSIEADGVQWEITVPLPRPNAANGDATPSKAEFVDAIAPREEGDSPDMASALLAGKRFLVIEDEPLVALEMVGALHQAGAEIAGPVGTAAEALALIERTRLDAALLDANLRGRPVDDIAATLTRQQVPFAFVTGYGREELPLSFAEAAMLSKPFSQQQLLKAAAELVQKPADVLKLRV